jgi:DNA-binding PadR family transcriptional regulator
MIGELERLALLAVGGLDEEEAYGLAVQRSLAAAGRELTPGAVYTTLDRLERKGLLTSRWGAPTAVRGGRAKRLYRVTGEGRRLLRDAELAARRLQGGALGAPGGGR